MQAKAERPDPLRSGPQLRSFRTGAWLTDHDLSGPLVIFIHGFASNSASLERLAAHIDPTFRVAVFDYLSHDGIDRGAEDLARRLTRFAARLSRSGFALVGHSMGGLVAKWFARHADARLRQALSGVATLCSPHGTAMPSRAPATRRLLLAVMLDLFENNQPPNPFNRSLTCAAARQLLGEDPRGLIDSLLEADNVAPLDLPLLTLSGGRNYIELFEPGARVNQILNGLIQANLGLPNDGLVEERSADLSQCVKVRPSRSRHVNDYGAWSQTNHTHVVDNQDVGDLLLDWLKAEVFPRSE